MGRRSIFRHFCTTFSLVRFFLFLFFLDILFVFLLFFFFLLDSCCFSCCFIFFFFFGGRGAGGCGIVLAGWTFALAKSDTVGGGVDAGRVGVRRQTSGMGQVCERPLSVRRDAVRLDVLDLPHGLSALRQEEVQYFL